jgi:WD40 repeat protein
MIKNPFPGPQPYRASDRQRFYGREDISYKLECSLLTNRCITVYGPSGAGKSSLVQASVLPSLIEYQDVRVVRVDGWPEGEDPTRWIANAMYTDLRLGEVPADVPSTEAVLAGARRAARGSSRLMIIYLDQLEQLLYMNRSPEETEPFFACLHQLVDLPLRTVRVILSLREDYLGRFRDRLRDRQRVLDGGFRVGPLTVAELTDAVCKTAASGEPSQTWAPDQMRTLMLQVRVPGQAAADEAEAQSAYAQIVCRALFQQRALGGAAEGDATGAERILQSYLETTLQDLGPLREAAQRLLEDHLVTADGSRTLRTEKELLRLLSAEKLQPCLRALESAAILHAEEHQGSRYFEIGHDWLARKVYEQRQAREQQEAQQRREQEQQRELEQQRAEAEERLRKARRQRRTLMIIAGASLGVAGVTGGLGVWALQEQAKAKEQKEKADAARVEAEEQRDEARDQRILAGFLALSGQGKSASAMKLLAEVKRPAERPGWVSFASDALNKNALRATLYGHTAALSAAAFAPDGKRVLTASSDGTARVWSADGRGQPVVLKGHEDSITSAAWSRDGGRVLTTSDDGTARVWNADGKGQSVVLKGAGGSLVSGAWSADGKRVVTASRDKIARIYAADGSGAAIELGGHHTKPLTSAMFLPDGVRVVTASEDGTARVWDGDAKGKSVVLRGHTAAVLSVTVSPDGARIVTTSSDRTARVFRADGLGVPVELKGHEGAVRHAAVSPDGTRVATASNDRTARIWSIDGTGEPVVLTDHEQAVAHVAFRPDGQFVATASSDQTARIWPSDGKGAPLVLKGHAGPVRSVAWSPDGASLVTAAGEQSDRSADSTAKVWSADLLQSLPRGPRDAAFFHGATMSADGALMVAAYDDNTARLHHVGKPGEPVRFEERDAWIASATLSPSGDRVVTASFDKKARVWPADGKGKPVELAGHEGAVRFAVMSPDGTRVVTVSEDRTARVWRADGSGTPVVLKGHEDWLTSAAWSPDSARVVTTSLDRTARVFRADGSGESIKLSGHRGAVLGAAFDRDGKRVVTASKDGTARVWNADGTGEPRELPGDAGEMLRAVFSDDGKRVAASSVGQRIHVWSLEGKEPPIVLNVKQPAIALSFIDKDQKLLTVASDNSIDRWMLDVTALRAGLASAHTDCLPADVRSQFLGETDADARKAFDKCESSYGRKPEGPKKDEEDLAASGPRVKVIILPGDAEVEADGVLVRRRDGIVELTGKPGAVRRLRVIKGATYLEKEVTIQVGAAPPELINLMAKIVSKAGPVVDKPLKPGQGNFEALMPDTLE